MSLLGQASAGSAHEYVPEMSSWAARHGQGHQPAPASPTRLTPSLTLILVWHVFLVSQPEISVNSQHFHTLPWLPHMRQPKQWPVEDQDVHQFSMLTGFALKGLWKRDPGTCLLEQWLFQGGKVRQSAHSQWALKSCDMSTGVLWPQE